MPTKKTTIFEIENKYPKLRKEAWRLAVESAEHLEVDPKSLYDLELALLYNNRPKEM